MNNEPVAWISVLGIDLIGQKFTDIRVSLTKTDVADIPLYTHPAKTLTDRIAELENQLGFIASINRAGLGVLSGTPMSSEKIEKIWNAIEEQKDDNFHYGWKKCEQYYGFSYSAKTLTDDEIAKLADDILGYQIYGYKESGVYEFARAILRKAQEK